MPPRDREHTHFFLASARWLAGLASLWLCFQVLSAPPVSGGRSALELAWRIPGVLGLLLPFTAFAGGLTLSMVVEVSRRGILFGSLLALPAYGLLAYVRPIAVYKEAVSLGRDVAIERPMGPSTSGQLRARREAVLATPPATYSFRVSRPLESPPNWLTYQIHSPAVLALFAILGTLLGQFVGFLTSGLSPPARRNARWALGLISSLAFFIAEVAGGEWVRLDPGNSGLAGAWLPMLVPMVELALLVFLARRRALHARPGSHV